MFFNEASSEEHVFHAVTAPVVECRVSPLRTSLTLFFADAITVLVARTVALVLWHQINPKVGVDQDFGLLISAAIFLLVYAGQGLYAARGMSPVEELRRIVLGAGAVSLILATASFLIKELGHSRGVFLLSFILIVTLVPLGRAIARHFGAGKEWWGLPVFILGSGDPASLVIRALREQTNVSLRPIACFDDGVPDASTVAGIPVAGPSSAAAQMARDLKVRYLIIARPELDSADLVRLIERCGDAFSHVSVVPNVSGIATLWVSARDLGGVLGLEVRQNLLFPMNQWLKRTLDIAMGIAFGLLSIPVLLVAGGWVAMASGGAPLFRQEREGLLGRKIRIWKLRTMYLNAEQLLEAHLEADPEARAEWSRFFKLKHDPRILPGIGTLLRRTSLDELPQIWNVLCGEMSMVGPRPLPSYHLNFFDAEFRSFRAKVRPGLTGLWQVSARSDGDVKIQEALDIYYIRNWSLWLDLHVLGRTVGAVLQGRGAY